MIEQNLAALFADLAKEIKWHRTELVAIVPEVDELCGGIDELTEFLEHQSHVLSRQGDGFFVPLCKDTKTDFLSDQNQNKAKSIE